jgi:hypothetical protein
MRRVALIGVILMVAVLAVGLSPFLAGEWPLPWWSISVLSLSVPLGWITFLFATVNPEPRDDADISEFSRQAW